MKYVKGCLKGLIEFIECKEGKGKNTNNKHRGKELQVNENKVEG